MAVDIFLCPPETPPTDIRLCDPTVSRALISEWIIRARRRGRR